MRCEHIAVRPIRFLVKELLHASGGLVPRTRVAAIAVDQVFRIVDARAPGAFAFDSAAPIATAKGRIL